MPSWTDQPAVRKHKLREALLTFLPNISRQYLVNMQQKTDWIKTIIEKVKLQKSHKEFFLFHDILLKKFKTENNIIIDQIVLPIREHTLQNQTEQNRTRTKPERD